MRGEYPALVSVWMVDGSLWKYMKAGKLDSRGAMSMVRLIMIERFYTYTTSFLPRSAGSQVDWLICTKWVPFMRTSNLYVVAFSTGGLNPFITLLKDNVLISPKRQALLTDFGISQMTGLTQGCTTDSLGGSVNWLAKELCTSQDKHTKETDVWAFGMTVYVRTFSFFQERCPLFSCNRNS